MLKISGGPLAGQADEEFFKGLRMGCDQMLEDTLVAAYSFKKQKKTDSHKDRINNSNNTNSNGTVVDGQQTFQLYKSLAHGARKNKELLNLWRSVEKGEKREEWESFDVNEFLADQLHEANDRAEQKKNHTHTHNNCNGSLQKSDHEKKAAYLSHILQQKKKQLAKLQQQQQQPQQSDEENVGVADLLRKYYDGSRLKREYIHGGRSDGAGGPPTDSTAESGSHDVQPASSVSASSSSSSTTTSAEIKNFLENSCDSDDEFLLEATSRRSPALQKGRALDGSNSELPEWDFGVGRGTNGSSGEKKDEKKMESSGGEEATTTNSTNNNTHNNNKNEQLSPRGAVDAKKENRKSKLLKGQEMGMEGSERGVEHLLSKYYGKTPEESSVEGGGVGGGGGSGGGGGVGLSPRGKKEGETSSASCNSNGGLSPRENGVAKEVNREKEKAEMVGDDYQILAEGDGQIKLLVDMVMGKEERRNKRRKEKEDLRNRRKSREPPLQPQQQQPSQQQQLAPTQPQQLLSPPQQFLDEEISNAKIQKRISRTLIREREVREPEIVVDREKDKVKRVHTMDGVIGGGGIDGKEPKQKRASRVLFMGTTSATNNNYNNHINKDEGKPGGEGDKEQDKERERETEREKEQEEETDYVEKEKEREKENELDSEESGDWSVREQGRGGMPGDPNHMTSKKKKRKRGVTQPRESLFVYKPSEFFATRNKKEDVDVIKRKLRKVKRYKGDRYEGVAAEDLCTVEGMMERFFSPDKLIRKSGEYVIRVKLMLEHLRVST